MIYFRVAWLDRSKDRASLISIAPRVVYVHRHTSPAPQERAIRKPILRHFRTIPSETNLWKCFAFFFQRVKAYALKEITRPHVNCIRLSREYDNLKSWAGGDQFSSKVTRRPFLPSPMNFHILCCFCFIKFIKVQKVYRLCRGQRSCLPVFWDMKKCARFESVGDDGDR